MDIGFNFTLGNTLPMVQRFRDDGLIDYCELLIDNFAGTAARPGRGAGLSGGVSHHVFPLYRGRPRPA